MADMQPADIPQESKPATETPKRRGRPPGSTNKPKAKDTDVALSVMEGFYDFLSLGLLMVSPDASMQLEQTAPKLQEKNRSAFEASPALAARIAKIGSTGGTMSFIIANAVALYPVFMIAYQDVTAKLTESENADTKDSV